MHSDRPLCQDAIQLCISNRCYILLLHHLPSWVNEVNEWQMGTRHRRPQVSVCRNSDWNLGLKSRIGKQMEHLKLQICNEFLIQNSKANISLYNPNFVILGVTKFVIWIKFEKLKGAHHSNCVKRILQPPWPIHSYPLDRIQYLANHRASHELWSATHFIRRRSSGILIEVHKTICLWTHWKAFW